MEQISFEMEELLPIVAQLAEQYAGYESTSVTYERAELLMEAVIYCIHEYEISDKHDITVGKITAKNAYKAGMKLVQEKVEHLMREYEEMMQDFCDYGNHALRDTIRKGIPAFLKRYDIKYEPQNTILTLDYPVLTDLHQYSGIDRVYLYVRAIAVEQSFLRRYDKEYVREILNAYSGDYADMLENVASIVFMNTIGHILANKPMTAGLEENDYQRIQSEFKKDTLSLERVRLLADEFLNRYYGEKKDVVNYLCMELPNILTRIGNAVHYCNLDKVFVK